MLLYICYYAVCLSISYTWYVPSILILVLYTWYVPSILILVLYTWYVPSILILVLYTWYSLLYPVGENTKQSS